MKKIYLFLLFNVAISLALNAQIRYVKVGGEGAKTGLSWEDASDDLQATINASSTGEQVWVAKGTYRPTQNLTGTDNADKSFVLKTGVKIYGGFVGNELPTYNLSLRNFITNETILNGDFGDGTNAHHVLVNTTAITSIVLSGFTITGGNANGSSTPVAGIDRRFGGGLYLSYSGTDPILLENLKFVDNTAITRAGAIYLTRASGSTYVDINDCVFERNGNALGGAIFHNSGKLNVNNSVFENCTGTNGGAIDNGNTATSIELYISGCTFRNNTAANGAALYNYTGTMSVEGTKFENNIATARGAGIYHNNGTVKLTKSSFDGNNATLDGGAIYRYGGAGGLDIDKSIFKNNVAGGDAGAVKVIYGTTKVFNSVFYNNTAQEGGALYVGNSAGATVATLIVVNNTFFRNRDVNRGGVVTFLNTAGRASLKMYNNIMAENTSTNGSADIRMTSLETPSTVQNNPIELHNNLTQSTFSSQGNLTVGVSYVYNASLPLFVSITDTDINFLHLVEGQASQKGSSALATTEGLIPGTDLLEGTRETHGIVDLGAYEYQGVLPVQFDYFKAAKLGSTANLTWRTIAETNNSHFTVERGSSISNFTELTRKAAAGTTTETTTYNFVDQNPLNGTNYYRLTQYDNNGDFKILGEQVLTFSLNSSQNLVYPNPATKQVFVKLGEAKGIVTVDLVSLTGQTILAKAYNISGNEEITIDLADVPRGSYVLWLNRGKNNNDRKKLLVVK